MHNLGTWVSKKGGTGTGWVGSKRGRSDSRAKAMHMGPFFTVTTSYVDLVTTSDLPLINPAFP